MLEMENNREVYRDWQKMLKDPVFWYNMNIPKYKGHSKGWYPPLKNSLQFPIIIEHIVDHFYPLFDVSKDTLRLQFEKGNFVYIRLSE